MEFSERVISGLLGRHDELTHYNENVYQIEIEEYNEQKVQLPEEIKDLGQNICDPENLNECINKIETGCISDPLNLNENYINVSAFDNYVHGEISDLNVKCEGINVKSEIINVKSEIINVKSEINEPTIQPTEFTEENMERNDDDDFNINNTSMMPSALVEIVMKDIEKESLAPKHDAEKNQAKKKSRLRVVPIQKLKRTWMNYSWTCYYCKSLFPNIDELQTHSMQMHNSCKPYTCAECKSTLKNLNLNTFITHVRTHKKYLNHSCYRCFKMFPTLDETEQHTKEDHESSDYICVGCNITFPGQRELTEHISKYFKTRRKPRIIATVEDLTCTICNKIYPNLESIKRHKMTHEDRERQYVCHICGRSYLNKRDCKIHVASHDSNTVYPQCNICKRTFKTQHSLKVHASIHLGIKPFTCDVCGKSFRTNRYLIKHNRSHTDDFPLTCAFCEKKFRSKANLKNHIVQHTGEKPYACEVCKRCFANLSNRNKHMRQVHDIEMVKKKPPELIASDLITGDYEFSEVDVNDIIKQEIIEPQTRGRKRKSKKIK